MGIKYLATTERIGHTPDRYGGTYFGEFIIIR